MNVALSGESEGVHILLDSSESVFPDECIKCIKDDSDVTLNERRLRGDAFSFLCVLKIIFMHF